MIEASQVLECGVQRQGGEKNGIHRTGSVMNFPAARHVDVIVGFAHACMHCNRARHYRNKNRHTGHCSTEGYFERVTVFLEHEGINLFHHNNGDNSR